MSIDRRIVVFAVLILVALAAFAFRPTGSPAPAELSTFRTYADLARFLDRAGPSGGGAVLLEGDLAGLGAEAGFSRTNVQVQGVDELDTVKTDGEYLYLVSSNNVSIVRATPPGEMQIVARITATDLGVELDPNTTVYIAGMFVDSDRLAVVSSAWAYVWLARETIVPGPGPVPSIEPQRLRTWVSIFDLSTISSPQLEFAFGVTGTYLAARSTSGHVYLIAQDYVIKYEDLYLLPETCSEDACITGDSREIWYDPQSKEAGLFTNILAVNVETGDHETFSVLTGWTSTIYMSPQALYLSFLKWEGDLSSPDGWMAGSFWTSVYKIVASGVVMGATASGDVPGALLNQFSMDEHEGYLRVATTIGWGRSNSVYVLNETLGIVGALEGIAEDEQIFAARFVGDSLYLVTFRQIDPFFVIDLSDPTDPRLLGELEIPGFSSYLHPVDSEHILGIGQENWTLKVSLFDVSDPAHPVESSRWTVANTSWSEALYDHKAVLFDGPKALFVLPIYGWDGESGAYVFRVTPTDGISLRGVISHGLAYANVYRSLYIGDTLYTVSPYTVKANALSDLSEIGSLEYESPPDWTKG